MRHLIVIAFIAGLMACSPEGKSNSIRGSAVYDSALGMSQAQVVNAFGRPGGRTMVGNEVVWLYEERVASAHHDGEARHPELRFASGVVNAVHFIIQDQYEALREKAMTEQHPAILNSPLDMEDIRRACLGRDEAEIKALFGPPASTEPFGQRNESKLLRYNRLLPDTDLALLVVTGRVVDIRASRTPRR